jgi:pyrroline-5-carboxylate reductase
MKIAILGGGNIGLCIAKGLVDSGSCEPSNVWITRRNTDLLEPFRSRGFNVTSDNQKAVAECDIILVCVRPLQLTKLCEQIRPALNDKHILISIVSGVDIAEFYGLTGVSTNRIIRAMPNTGIAVRESMTCLAGVEGCEEAMQVSETIFNSVGKTLVISEDYITPVTALCACGTAFFLRAIRAASQGGIEIGFHSDESLFMAAQTAKGAAELILASGSHPEAEIDKVTTPRGCTIAGLNRMEHEGFSSAMIKGIVTSADIAGKLYSK